MSRFSGLVFALVVLCASSANAQAPCGDLDQSCEPIIGPTFGHSMYCTPEEELSSCLLQSFTPTMDYLCGVELFFYPAAGTVTLFLQNSVVPGESVLAVATQDVESGGDNWISFDFGGVTIQPGATYYLHPVSHSNNGWATERRVEGGCEYPGGTAYSAGEEKPYDWLFRTYGTIGPVPTLSRSWGQVKSIYQ
ncbi:MAG: hypothetical protein H6760_04750 [Candidatus Nomurabacteria bacterium]|nr:MAG: hypothetical protein H6760_04750 [Candidatus Nomurabacteria bacterium]